MIFDLSKFSSDDKRIVTADPTLAKAQFANADWSKFEVKAEAKYFTASVTAVDLTRDGRYTHPHHDDVIIRGELQYALEAVLTAKKTGVTWEFQLLLRELKTEQYAPTKSFARGAD